MSNQGHKAIFITGSSSGLGRATAKLFASKGWKVIASMRDPNKEKELAKISGVVLMSLDVTDPHEIKGVAEQVVASGGVDVVFNNAGYGLGGPLEGLTDDQILRMVNTNMHDERKLERLMSGCESEQRSRRLSGRHQEDADRHVFHSVQRHGHDERDRLIAIPNPSTGSNKRRSQHNRADHQYSGKRQNDGNRYRRTSITSRVG
jgi:NAD(P)-dependent dehydrogenase (short-subunit alcohol dehydrogenase family)